MNFASDNTAGIAPEILQALVAGNDGFAMGYGNDDVTRAVERRIGEIFEHDVAVFLVPTGTAANALALAHVSPPWGAVFAHAEAHILTDECGAPEFFGGGLKLVGMPGVGCKVTPDTLAETVSHYEGHTPHQVVPAAFSFAQASEAGTIYRPDEIAALAKVAHAHGMKVHMDGARFANALVRMNASPAEITWKSGVDVLSFGATKGGALAAEAVVFFDPRAGGEHGRAAQARRSPAVQASLPRAAIPGVPRRRLLAAAGAPRQRHGRPAGRGARRRRPSRRSGRSRPISCSSSLPKAVEARLKAAGARYYVRRSESLPAAACGPDQCLIRLVTSFATREDEVDQFVTACRKGVTGPPQRCPNPRRCWRPGSGTVEGILVKPRMIFAALAVLALVGAGCGRAAAPGPGRCSPARCRPTRFSPSLRSTGFDPLGQPMRRGPNYVLRAIDDNDREVQRRRQRALRRYPVGDAGRRPRRGCRRRGRRHHGPLRADAAGLHPAERPALCAARRSIEMTTRCADAPRRLRTVRGAPPARGAMPPPVIRGRRHRGAIAAAVRAADRQPRRRYVAPPLPPPSERHRAPIRIAAACCRRRRSVSRSACASAVRR